jgi:hypothetical protein
MDHTQCAECGASYTTEGDSRGARFNSLSSLVAPTVTIADLDDFAADTYPLRLDAWCRAGLEMWGATL